MRCLSEDVANPHQVGEAYSNLASTPALYNAFQRVVTQTVTAKNFKGRHTYKWRHEHAPSPTSGYCNGNTENVNLWHTVNILQRCGGYRAEDCMTAAVHEDNFYGLSTIKSKVVSLTPTHWTGPDRSLSVWTGLSWRNTITNRQKKVCSKRHNSSLLCIPLLNSKHGDATDLDMYRGITLSPVLSKAFESVLLLLYNEFLSSDPLQFGFKKNS